MPVWKSRVGRVLCLAVVACTAGLLQPAAAGATKGGDQADSVEPFARDVFVIVGSTLRNPSDTTADDAPLFNDAGVGLNLTWGQWRAGSATSVMRAAGHHTDTDLTLSGLVPNGTYSLFYGTLTPDTQNPACPGVERTLPLTSRDLRQSPDAASFIAGPDGTATFSSRISGDPLAATQVFITVVFHNDGQTYGSLPNRGESLTQGEPMCRSSFGEDAMRQFLILQKW